MKNVHLLLTDNKLSRLYFNVNDKEFQICEIEKPSTILKPNRHIYITSDEEIQEGNWYLELNEIHKFKLGCFTDINSKKITLTTDQDLIKDGVQSIDDEFLEWFVNNPSCESVEITYHRKGVEGIFKNVKSIRYYGLIIPKEEPKQECMITKIMQMDAKMAYDSLPKQDEIMERFIANAKQETTLEEVAEQYAEIYRCPATNDNEYCRHDIISAINFGAKWQQEQIGKSEFLQKLRATKSNAEARRLIFEQFKKK